MKINKLWLLTGISILLCSVFLFLIFQRKYVYPNSDVYWYSYNDSNVQGNSQIEVHQGTNEALDFSFLLNKDFEYPFIGISFIPKREMNLRYFSHLNVKVSSDNSQSLRFFIKTNIPGYSYREEQLTYPHFQADIPLWDKTGHYRFTLNDLAVVFWWYNATGWNPEENPIGTDFERVAFLDIQSGEVFDMDQWDTVSIRQIYFTRNPVILTAILLILLAFKWSAILVYKRYIETQRIELIPKIIEDLDDYKEISEDLRGVLLYIAREYPQKKLSLEVTGQFTGHSSSWISAKLREKYGISFNHYITLIRMHESKRLLEESDFSIQEISERVGFRSRSHFSSLFSKTWNISPREYKKNHSHR